MTTGTSLNETTVSSSDGVRDRRGSKWAVLVLTMVVLISVLNLENAHDMHALATESSLAQTDSSSSSPSFWTTVKSSIGSSMPYVSRTQNVISPAVSLNETWCPGNLVYIEDVIRESSKELSKHMISPIIFQTSKSRCVAPEIADIIQRWRDNFPEYSYRFYDDEAMDAMLYDEKWDDLFPGLRFIVKCIDMVHNPTMKTDLWRYLVLWEYGGIYSDIDTMPTTLLTSSEIHPDDDGLFFIERIRILAQYCFAVSPKHPVMYYALHTGMENLRNKGDMRSADAARMTGPNALKGGHRFFIHNLTAVHYMTPRIVHEYNGTRSFRLEEESPYIVRDALGHSKVAFYKTMNMTHFHQRNHDPSHKTRPTGSCFTLLHAEKHENGFIVDGEVVNITVPSLLSVPE